MPSKSIASPAREYTGALWRIVAAVVMRACDADVACDLPAVVE
jgi:hypothetical protein